MIREPKSSGCKLREMTALENKTNNGKHLPGHCEMQEKADLHRSWSPTEPAERQAAYLTFTMIHNHFRESVLVLLISSTILSLELKLVLFQQRRVNRESSELLKKWQPSSIRQCLPHRRDFLLPQEAGNPHQDQKGSALTILHEMLQQIFSLFQANTSLEGWKESHMERFLIELHQQLEYLETLRGLQTDQKSSTVGREKLRLQVKMYFRRIRDYLENQKYSGCAWTVVQVEVNRCLFFVLPLTGKLRQQETDP